MSLGRIIIRNRNSIYSLFLLGYFDLKSFFSRKRWYLSHNFYFRDLVNFVNSNDRYIESKKREIKKCGFSLQFAKEKALLLKDLNYPENSRLFGHLNFRSASCFVSQIYIYVQSLSVIQITNPCYCWPRITRFPCEFRGRIRTNVVFGQFYKVSEHPSGANTEIKLRRE